MLSAITTLSSNAVLAKAHAMYGRRLTNENYTDLLACQTVGDVASYLKNRTAYSRTLAGINENTIHRGQLEFKLKQKLLDDYASLCRYEITVGERFSQYLIEHSEIDQILHSLLLLDAGKPEEYLFSMPGYLNRLTHIDLIALSHMKNFDDLLDALSNTPYRKILEPFKPEEGVPINYTGIEQALYTYRFSNIFEIIDKYTHGETKKQLREIFDSYVDLQNYVRIVRLRVSYQSDPEFIRGSLLPFGNLSPQTIDKMIEADTEKEITDVMSKTTIAKEYLKIGHAYIDEIPTLVNYFICRRNIRFSIHPSVVMMSYTFISQCELADIITIVEGVRYKLPPEEIAKLLIVYNYKRKE